MRQDGFLTFVLSRAVIGVRVDSARIVESDRATYWIEVEPDHFMYWRRFKEEYPHWVTAYKYKASFGEYGCPDFATRRDLISWLFSVLGLTKGERRLLQVWGGWRCPYFDSVDVACCTESKR